MIVKDEIRDSFERQAGHPRTEELLEKSSLPDHMCPSYAASERRNGLSSELETLMTAHLPLLRTIAKHIYGTLAARISLEDLISAGTTGLLDATKCFDPRKRISFRTYARFRIRRAIVDYLRSLDWVSGDLRQEAKKIPQATNALRDRSGRSPTEEEVAAALQIDSLSYQWLLSEKSHFAVAGTDVGTNSSSDGVVRQGLEQNPLKDTLSQALSIEIGSRLSKAIETLAERERLVITLYYHEEISIEEVGLVLGIAEYQVYQIHASALARLRTALRLDRKAGGQ